MILFFALSKEGSQIHPRTSELKGKVCKKNDSDGPSKDLVRAQSLPSTDSGNVDGGKIDLLFVCSLPSNGSIFAWSKFIFANRLL